MIDDTPNGRSEFKKCMPKPKSKFQLLIAPTFLMDLTKKTGYCLELTTKMPLPKENVFQLEMNSQSRLI